MWIWSNYLLGEFVTVAFSCQVLHNVLCKAWAGTTILGHTAVLLKDAINTTLICPFVLLGGVNGMVVSSASESIAPTRQHSEQQSDPVRDLLLTHIVQHGFHIRHFSALCFKCQVKGTSEVRKSWLSIVT